MTAATMIVPYRARDQHLACFCAWVTALEPEVRHSIELIIIEASLSPTRAATDAARRLDAKLVNVAYDGVFAKARMLNLGLGMASSGLILAYDIDLVPIGPTLGLHLQLASAHRDLLFTGYRLMHPRERVDVPVAEELVQESATAVEDREVSHRLHLLHGYRFGISPIFERCRLESIGGWDEGYVGWGAEDQDLIDRYLATGVRFVRSPDLVYLHLHHEPVAGWNDLRYVVANRDRYIHRRGDKQR